MPPHLVLVDRKTVDRTIDVVRRRRVALRSTLAREFRRLLVGLAALALLTWLGFWFEFRLVTMAFAYLILTLLLSLSGSFVTPLVVSLLAIGCLAYFFVFPIYSFRIDSREDFTTVAAFLLTSLIVSGLVRRVKARTDELANLLDSIRALVWRASPDGAVDFSNQRFRDYTGLAAEALRGWGWTAALHPDDRRSEEWRALFAAGQRFEREARVRSADGDYRWFVLRLMPIRTERGTMSKWYGIASDVEDRRRTLEALRDSEEQWRAVFENNPVMYFMVDAAGTIISVNPFGAAQLGYAVDELIGRPVHDIFHESDRETVRSNTAVCFKQPGKALTWELRNIRKNGEVIRVRETAIATVIKKNPVLLMVCEDITEAKRVTEALREVQTALAHANRVASLGQPTKSINPSLAYIAARWPLGAGLTDLIWRRRGARSTAWLGMRPEQAT
jgi:PAS domain S-box-containing protein